MSEDSHRVRSVHRAFTLLEILSSSESGLGVSELSRRTGWPKSSIFNILVTLDEDGFIVQDPQTSRYRLSVKLFAIASSSVAQIELREVARPLLRDLAEATRHTVNLGILDGDEAIYVEVVGGTGPVRMNAWPGKRLELHCTALGKALLADRSPDQVRELVDKAGLPERTPNTLSDLESLFSDLASVRERGYSIDDEEDVAGIRCIGAPIRDQTGTTVAALSVTALAKQLTHSQIPEVAGRVVATGERLSDLLGYRTKDDAEQSLSC